MDRFRIDRFNRINRKWAIVSIVAGILATTALIGTLFLFLNRKDNVDMSERKYTEIEL
jgi:hypothetical protein